MGAHAQEGVFEVSDNPLEPYLGAKIRLCIFDRMLLSQTQKVLTALKFKDVEAVSVNPGYIESVRQVAALLMEDAELVLLNPPLFVSSGRTKQEKSYNDFFSDLKILVGRSRRNWMEYLAKGVPILAEASLSEIREMLLMSLAEYGVSAAFILAKQASLIGMTPDAKMEEAKAQLIERFQAIREYLIEYFGERDEALGRLKRRRDEMEEEQQLSASKGEAAKWMAEADKFKKSRDWEQAIMCYKRAIDAYPADPEAYLESGRAFVVVKQYPKALTRFRQAEEVARDLPTPNKEIGHLRVLQVTEMVDQGEPPDSPKVQALLAEAGNSFQRALDKAATIKPLHAGDDPDRAEKATLDIVQDIVKLNLEEVVGPRNPVAQELLAMATKALPQAAMTDPEQMPAAHLVVMGWNFFREGNSAEAERYLFLALKDKDQYDKTCSEINLMGAQIRKRVGPDEAIRLYNKLLELDPPNKAAVHFNLAVAWDQKRHQAATAGSIVQALYIDPALARDDEFYESPPLWPLLLRLLDIFGRIGGVSTDMAIEPETLKLQKLQEALEGMIVTRDQKALNMLHQTMTRLPKFWSRNEVYFSRPIMDYLTQVQAQYQKRPEAEKLVRLIGALLNRKDKLDMPDNVRVSLDFQARAMAVLAAAGDQSRAANLLARALINWPERAAEPEFYANRTLVNLGKEIFAKLQKIDRARLTST